MTVLRKRTLNHFVYILHNKKLERVNEIKYLGIKTQRCCPRDHGLGLEATRGHFEPVLVLVLVSNPPVLVLVLVLNPLVLVLVLISDYRSWSWS